MQKDLQAEAEFLGSPFGAPGSGVGWGGRGWGLRLSFGGIGGEEIGVLGLWVLPQSKNYRMTHVLTVFRRISQLFSSWSPQKEHSKESTSF